MPHRRLGVHVLADARGEACINRLHRIDRITPGLLLEIAPSYSRMRYPLSETFEPRFGVSEARSELKVFVDEQRTVEGVEREKLG